MSSSSSSLSDVSSKIAPKACFSSKLPWATGESSVLTAERVQLPLGSMQEKSMQVTPAPTPIPIVDSKPSKSNYKKIGKKILDLRLPAYEYIDVEEGESLEDAKASKVAGLSAYTLDGVSQVEHNINEKPYGANSNNFADLNELFEVEDEAALKPDDLVDNTPLRNTPVHALFRRTNLGPQNLPHDVIQYSKLQQDTQACSDDPPLEQGKKHEQLSSIDCAGENLIAKLHFSYYTLCYHIYKLLDEISSYTCLGQIYLFIYLLVIPSSYILKNGNFSFSGQRGGNLDSFAENLSSSSEPFKKKLKQVNDLPGFRSLDQINRGPWSKEKNSSGESSAGTQGPTNDGLLLGPGFAQLVHKDVGDPRSTNLNVLPAVCSEITAFESSWVNRKEKKLQDSTQGLPWLKEKPVPNRQLNEESKVSTQVEPVLVKLGGIHGIEIKKIDESDLYREKILGFPISRKPHTCTNLHSSHASPSKVCQNQSDSQKIVENGRDGVLDVNIPCNLPDLGQQMPEGEHYTRNEIENKHKRLAGIIDLNACLNEDEDMLIAPENSENKECAPPRGESNEKELEYQLAGQEDQVRIAAEVLVSVSASVAQNGLQMTTYSSSDPSPNSPLHWFAGIICSIKDQSENEVKEDCSGKTDDLDEFLPAGIDYFEAMTLKLTETQNLDCCCNKISIQTEGEGRSTSPPKKGRAKRGRRQKDFQSEILPSLVSLSKYEVTEDLQTIGGLIEAAGTHLETGSLRNVWGRGKKRSHASASASNVTDTLLKQQTNNSELDIEKRGLIVSLENICRKPRGKRYPNSKPQFSLNKLYN